jgi:hypothetical protein
MLTVIALLDASLPAPKPQGYWERAFGSEYASNWALVTAAILTLFFVGWQAYETRRAAQIGNKTLIASLRPRLTLRSVWLRTGTAIPTMGIPDAEPWRVEYSIANCGGSQAHIIGASFMVVTFDKNELPAVPPYTNHVVHKDITLQPGEDRESSVGIEVELVSLFRMMGVKGGYLAHQRTAFIYFLGHVRYKDDLGIVRRLAVLRHFDTASGRFTVVDDPQYEYAD